MFDIDVECMLKLMSTSEDPMHSIFEVFT